MGRLPPVIVVFDMNIYLDVARLVKELFSRETLQTKLMIHRYNSDSSPESLISSAQVVAICASGVFAGTQKLQVWTNSWIENGVVKVAKRPRNESGLGWSAINAESLRMDLIHDTVITPSGGHSVPADKTANYDGLSWDDSQVLHTAHHVLKLSPYSTSICLTNDKKFRNTDSCGSVTMLVPDEFLYLIREARLKVAGSQRRS
jgi:hypothetical protein